MCGGGPPPPPDNSAALRQQKEQMEQQERQYQQQLAIQKAQYEEQKRIAEAPPPPAPNKVADVAAPALEMANAPAPAMIRQGTGRRKMRTDIANSGETGLTIPAV